MMDLTIRLQATESANERGPQWQPPAERPLFYEYACKLVADAKPVLHAGLNIIGIPVKAYAPGEYEDPDGNKIDCTVLRFEDGNAFLVNGHQGALVQLTEHEVAVHAQLVEDMNALIVGTIVELGRRDPQRHQEALMLIRAAITMQTRSLAP